MANKIIPKETIERYLRNELSASELSDFTFQMVMNPSIRKEVEATRIIFKTLQTTAAPTTSAPPSSGTKLMILAVASILILAIAGFFFFQKSVSTKNSTPDIELILPTEAPSNIPIAEAYIRNEFIETAIDLRDISVGKKVANFEVTSDGKMVNFSGLFVGNIQDAKVTVWNNQKRDFVEERFIFAKKVDLTEGERINFTINQSLAKGLYYFVVDIDDEVGKVGRFEVK